MAVFGLILIKATIGRDIIEIVGFLTSSFTFAWVQNGEVR